MLIIKLSQLAKTLILQLQPSRIRTVYHSHRWSPTTGLALRLPLPLNAVSTPFLFFLTFIYSFYIYRFLSAFYLSNLTRKYLLEICKTENWFGKIKKKMHKTLTLLSISAESRLGEGTHSPNKKNTMINVIKKSVSHENRSDWPPTGV